MPAVAYPTSLPYPALWNGVGRERRVPSSLPGNTQIRSRARDRVVDIDAVWEYTSDHMTTWRAWYETTLLNGERWFAITVPGDGGYTVKVLKFRTKSLKDSYIGNGVYRVSAQLQQRGRSAAPDAQPRYRWYSAIYGQGSGLFSTVEGAARIDAAAVVAANPTFLGFDFIDNLSYGTNGPGLYSAAFRIWYLSGATSLAEAYRIEI